MVEAAPSSGTASDRTVWSYHSGGQGLIGRPAHRDEAAMNGAQPLTARGVSWGLMGGHLPPSKILWGLGRPVRCLFNGIGLRSQGCVRCGGLALHPNDEDLSLGTPALGYSRRLPTGASTGGVVAGFSFARVGMDACGTDGVKGGAPIVQEMRRRDKLRGAPGCHLYTAAVSAARPAADYTARAIPHFEGVDLPLEEARILWQR